MKRSISVTACLAMASLIIACGTGPAAPSVVTTPTGPASTASGLPGTPAPTATAIASETTAPSASASPAGSTPTPTAVAPAGLIWTRIDDGPGFEGSSAYRLATQPGMMVMLGSRGSSFDEDLQTVAWYSADGEVWSEAALPGASDAIPGGVAALGDGFVVVGSPPIEPGDALVWTSADGQAWTKGDAPADAFVLRAVIQTASGVAAVGLSHDLEPVLWQSVDGNTWAPSTIAAEGSPYTVAVSDDGTLLVSGYIEGKPTLWRSVDGETWDPVNLPQEDVDAIALTARGNGFLLATEYSAEGTLWSSDDGIEWDEVLTSDSPFKVGRAGEGYLAIEGGLVLLGAPNSLWTSSDGMTWSEGDSSPFADAAVSTIISTAEGGALLVGYTEGADSSSDDTNLVVWVGRPTP